MRFPWAIFGFAIALLTVAIWRVEEGRYRPKLDALDAEIARLNTEIIKAHEDDER